MTSNNIDQIVLDGRGNIWALNQNRGIDVIDDSTGAVSQFPIMEYTNGYIPNYMITDTNQHVWVGFRNGVVHIDPQTGKIRTIPLEKAENAAVFSMLQVGVIICVSTSEGLWVVGKEEYTTHFVPVNNHVFYSIN